MSDSKKLPSDDPSVTLLVSLQAQIVAFRIVIAAILDSLPDQQQAFVRDTIEKAATTADQMNAESGAFTSGEEVTHQIQDTLSAVLKLAERMGAARRPT